MSFSGVDGGFAAPKPRPNNGVGSGIFSGLGGVIKDTANTISKPNYTPPPQITFTGNPAGQYDPNPHIPPYTPGPIGTSDGGAGAYNPNPDLSSLPGQVQPYQPQVPAMPDIASLFQKALANLGFNNLDNSLQKAREQLIIRWGDPALASQAGFGLDSQAGAFARQNYLSGQADLARLDKQREQARRAVINRLAAHGLLQSGALGYGLNNAETAYGTARYDLTNRYLDQLQALLENTLQQKQQLRSSVVNALLSAYGNYTSDPAQLIGLYAG